MKSRTIGKRTRNGLVADQPLVACTIMPIRKMLLIMGVIILMLFRYLTIRFAHVLSFTWHWTCFYCYCSCRQCTFLPKTFLHKNIQSRSPFDPQCFFRCPFILMTVSYGVPSLFPSPSINCLLNLSYYSRILAGNTSVFCHITLSGACNLVYDIENVLIALVLTSVTCFSAITRPRDVI